MSEYYDVEIRVWPFSTGKGRDVDQKNAGEAVQHFRVEADGMSSALHKANLIAIGILTNPHVWQAPIYKIVRIS